MTRPLPGFGFYAAPEAETLPPEDAAEITAVLTPLGATGSKTRGCYAVTVPASQSVGRVETTHIGRPGEPLLALVRRLAARSSP